MTEMLRERIADILGVNETASQSEVNRIEKATDTILSAVKTELMGKLPKDKKPTLDEYGSGQLTLIETGFNECLAEVCKVVGEMLK